MLCAGLTVVVLTIGIGFTLAGARPVLPFAGRETMAVGVIESLLAVLSNILPKAG